tara:strand:- start:1230 stop:1364 length:135 start_codon:yes stop_codon:yes gene_type:complete
MKIVYAGGSRHCIESNSIHKKQNQRKETNDKKEIFFKKKNLAAK